MSSFASQSAVVTRYPPPSCRLGWVSKVLCKPSRVLGTRIVEELATFTPVLSLEVEWEDELNAL